MSDDFKEKIRTINVGLASRRRAKQTVDDTEVARVQVTEHWDDRVDVTVRPDPVHVKQETRDA